MRFGANRKFTDNTQVGLAAAATAASTGPEFQPHLRRHLGYGVRDCAWIKRTMIVLLIPFLDLRGGHFLALEQRQPLMMLKALAHSVHIETDRRTVFLNGKFVSRDVFI